ncbi:MAG: PQQ-dependent sugar dehydrogenase [Bacteroidia bacterium]|nr:PQQ-dependent sugar dehydrogenase [Bacteroidia bacterium]
MQKVIKAYLITSIAVFALATFSKAQGISFTLFTSPLNRVVDIQHAGDERLFLVEKAGIIKICDLSGVVNPNPFLDITALVNSSYSEQGLLGLVFHPDYKSNRFFYVNYTDLAGNSVIARYQTSNQNPDSADVSSAFIVMTYNQPYVNHNGGSMNFGTDGYLYISTGDGGNNGDPDNNGQNKQTLLGKILRIDVDGGNLYTIPECNPFKGSSSSLAEIWAYGLRNPWRCSFDRLTGDFWIGDVGEGLWEEVNVQRHTSTGGENYGWRCYEATHAYNSSGCQPAAAYVMPVFEYSHSAGSGNCSVTGGYVYRGARFADLFGKYVFGDYCSGNIWSIDSRSLDSAYSGTFSNGEISCFGQDVYGELYVARNAPAGEVYKLESMNCAPVASFSITDTVTFCNSATGILRVVKTNLAYSYEWYFNGSLVAVTDTLVASQPGNYSLKVTASQACISQSPDVYVRFGTSVAAGFTGLPDTICINGGGPVQLTGSPAGGVFSGSGISGTMFDPVLAGEGSHCIRYSFTNLQGCTSTTVQTAMVVICGGIEDPELKDGIRVAPNPATDFVDIHFENFTAGNEVNLSLEDLSGRTLFTSEKKPVARDSYIHLLLPSLRPGIYLLKVNQSVFRLFIEQN